MTGMFCSAVIGAWHFGQVERGTMRLKRGAARRGRGAVALREFRALRAPLALQHHRHAVDDDIQEAAHQQPQHQHGADEEGRRGGQGIEQRPASALTAGDHTTEPSLKIGRYIAITRPPTSTPSTAMISGSSRLDIASTALSTSAS